VNRGISTGWLSCLLPPASLIVLVLVLGLWNFSLIAKRSGILEDEDDSSNSEFSLVTLGVSLSSTQFGGIDDERSRFAHFPNCGCRVVRLQIDAPARVFNHGGPNA
jgi:hypothetical protein